MVSFVKGRTLLLRLDLLADCIGISCPTGRSCTTAGRCDLADERHGLPDYRPPEKRTPDALAPDGGEPAADAADAGTSERQLDAAIPERIDAAANDGGVSDRRLEAGDMAPTGKRLAEPCAADGECASGLCKAVLPRGAPVCVRGCANQSDCAGEGDLVCEAVTPGSSAGYCIPRSPAHCASCAVDGDCGTLSERCLEAPGDDVLACHIDCALAGVAACPPDFVCANVQDGSVTRQLCRPAGGRCLASRGGFCERGSEPQPCARDGTAGMCTGQRRCDSATGRYESCDAQVPTLKASCADPDPPGCTLGHAPAATSTPEHCGACGKACPGFGFSTANVTCDDPATGACGFGCRGENYDVDGMVTNGCERLHTTPPGHTGASSAFLGTQSCDNSIRTFSGRLLSDTRVHSDPPIPGFNAMVGSAPDYWHIYASGGLCVNDWSVTLSMKGGGATPCYRLTVISNLKTQSTPVISGEASATITSGAGAYGEKTNVVFVVEKTCSRAVTAAANYTVQFHL